MPHVQVHLENARGHTYLRYVHVDEASTANEVWARKKALDWANDPRSSHHRQGPWAIAQSKYADKMTAYTERDHDE